MPVHHLLDYNMKSNVVFWGSKGSIFVWSMDQAVFVLLMPKLDGVTTLYLKKMQFTEKVVKTTIEKLGLKLNQY